MKKNLFFAIAIVAMLFTTSCRQVCLDNPLDRSGQVVFTGTAGATATRVTGNMWQGNESIGVFATTTNALTQLGIYEGASNRQFTNENAVTANAIFTAVSGQEILFPSDGSNIHFFAYYPFQATGITTDFTLPINTTTQNLTALDLMWATASGNNNQATVGLGFTRRMSQVEIRITTDASLPNLDGLTVTIEGLYRQAYLDLANGDVITRTDMGNIVPVMTHTAGTSTATANATVIPGQNIGGSGIVFRFTQGTNVLTWSPPSAVMMQAGRRYIYDVQLSVDAVSSVQLGATVVDWEDYVQTPDGPVTIHPPTSDPTFEVDVTGALPTFSETGGTEIVTLTADAGIDWTIVVTGNPWLKIEVDNVETLTGTGSAEIRISATPNTTAAARTATITITCDDDPNLYVEFGVKQEVGVLIFNETFGNPSANTTIANFTGWVTTGIGASSVTFSAAGGTVDVRTSAPSIPVAGASAGIPFYTGASGQGNVMFNLANGGTLFINNIGVFDTRNLLLSFGTNHNSSVLSVAYSVDGTNWTPIPFDRTVTPSNTSWGWVDGLPINLSDGTTTISLRFVAAPQATGSNARIDDVTIITFDTPSGY